METQGTNDTKPQNWNQAGTEYEADLRAFIAHFQKQPSKPAIYLCLPVPVYQDRWDINEKTVTEGVIPVIKKVAKEKSYPSSTCTKPSLANPECSSTKSTPTSPEQS